jgi:hypothetical protein
MRPIDADKAIEKHCADCSADVRERCKTNPLCGTIMWLNEVPTITYADLVPHGRWDEHYGVSICSNCHSMFDANLKMLQVPATWEMPNYCPNCGAKMDGGKDNEC